MYKRFCTRLIFTLLMQSSLSLNSYNSTSYTLYFNDMSDSSNDKNSSNSSEANLENGNYSNILKSDCIEPGSEKLCSGHGNCEGGTCNCDSLKSQANDTESLYEYSGKFCEECPYCKGQRCQKLFHCVEYILRNLSGESQCYIYYNLIDDIELNYNDKLCQVEDRNRCMIEFKYFYDDNNNVFIDIVKEIKCLNGRKFIVLCWCVFVIYIVALMTLFKVL
ncbi:integrin beta-PS-like [Anoplophora glabripennis]|uniref:integrin beta-PS-like n=1 Tax=Anoplophora glabripennis TaxID=217634 RepID=UPI0008736312|nr:integrin beta-PS-like [Anoplophora glabripennis]